VGHINQLLLSPNLLSVTVKSCHFFLELTILDDHTVTSKFLFVPTVESWPLIDSLWVVVQVGLRRFAIRPNFESPHRPSKPIWSAAGPIRFVSFQLMSHQPGSLDNSAVPTVVWQYVETVLFFFERSSRNSFSFVVTTRSGTAAG
jgi:hypothetical protein